MQVTSLSVGLGLGGSTAPGRGDMKRSRFRAGQGSGCSRCLNNRSTYIRAVFRNIPLLFLIRLFLRNDTMARRTRAKQLEPPTAGPKF